ncbi:hypothetical protein PIB30_083403 [Stylosanthes scabra]|uniref:Uncharacterized protein n=1 Tax=Stylosanthes scabra TaxID=79078 RepID=A0ABU6WV06_9FABA|nr:hypothetical protein [Stylosanthes scabra]
MNFSERSTIKNGVLEVDSVNALMTQLSAMNKKLEKLEASAVGTQTLEESSKLQFGRKLRTAKAIKQSKSPKFSKTTFIPFSSTSSKATKFQYDDDTFSLSVGKITKIFHVTRPPAPRKKGAHQPRVGTKKIEPEKLLRSEKRKEAENLKMMLS